MPLVLLVEDDATVRGALTHALSDAGHAVQSVATGLAALQEITANRPDLVVLDLGLPDIDGITALRMVRAVCDVPVIVATARRAEHDVIRLLNAGADDYLSKPFSSAHLAARIAAVLRRGRVLPGGPRSSPPIDIGGLHIDPDRRAAELDGRQLRLTRREFDLLAYLAARAGRVVGRRELVTEIWQQPHAGTDQTLDVHVSWLRRKLGETAAAPRFLHTVRGVGIMLVAPE
ncbi:MAG: response regulator transcription factor [Dactylosporangium sp.]|nr:response regulator transcription factor [Dactylosporangium sp.]NNJ61294.1 response regulator transcription factor [Dactylosporangium sp.]